VNPVLRVSASSEFVEKPLLPLINADERGFSEISLFSISVHPRLSAANLVSTSS
jgi:hypothetical protein